MYLNKFLSTKLVTFFLATAVSFASFAQEESKQNAVLVLGQDRTQAAVTVVANMIINNDSDKCDTPLVGALHTYELGEWKASPSKRDGLSVISTPFMVSALPLTQKYYDKFVNSIKSLQSSFNITNVVVIISSRPDTAMIRELLKRLDLTKVPVLVLASERFDEDAYSISQASIIALEISKHGFFVSGKPSPYPKFEQDRAKILAAINEMLDKSGAPVPMAVLPELDVKADVACQMTLLPWQTAALKALAQIKPPVRDSLVTELASKDAAQVEALVALMISINRLPESSQQVIAQLIATMKGA